MTDRYEPQAWYRATAWGMSGLFAAAAVVEVIVLALSHMAVGTAVILGAVLIAVDAFMIGMLLTKKDRLELTADSLRWKSIARSGDIPLGELSIVSLVPPRVVCFGSVSGAPIRMRESDNLADFVSSIRLVAPQIDVPAGLLPRG